MTKLFGKIRITFEFKNIFGSISSKV